MPLFATLIILEALICQFKGRFRLVDALVTLANWNLVKIADFFTSKYLILLSYTYFYNNYRALTLPWDSNFVWALTFFLNDHNYYWEHRFLHETMIGWSAHQVHHSSQDFNLTIGIRQSVFQKLFSAPFYIPLALLGIPPSLFMTHTAISAVHQLWIHTELIDGVSPLYDFFFNVPKHHQLHHGTNKYCIDQNYGGVLIIWDRIYGTFTEKDENKEEPIAYGLVYGSESYEFSYLQLRYYKFLLEEVRKEKTLNELLMRIYIYVVKGPSYNPKKPKFRTGDKADYPDGYPKYGLYDPKITMKNIITGFILVSKAYFVADFYLLRFFSDFCRH
ncbi:Oidioi.mRNA.OKI2018_I69.chr2.g4835.t1.cds [Oikopleura dioica]|uniref:Transmembrane protein 195 n=1 Tax=Oikopleura dioica TaxID=34765 RepID=A0ABN7T2V5_OIKDI|nr:Oidioi.mRNA.OKI2018_I69.chr2.g4835.t1.cds [Oikopleura dioica]